MLLTSLHVWLTFGTDKESQNTVEIGKCPPEKVQFHPKLLTFRGRGVRLTDLSQAIRYLVPPNSLSFCFCLSLSNLTNYKSAAFRSMMTCNSADFLWEIMADS